RVGGGFGIALRFARWAIHSRCGYRAGAPISGQRAMRGEVIDAVLPFAPGYGMEIGMTIDAVRAGYRVAELELDLEHRATGRTFAGFLHRGRQLRDFARVWWSRRRRSG
ncbi:MAG: glycosyltransferase family 2 protein, partial [Solirubrobacterales bacterium]